MNFPRIFGLIQIGGELEEVSNMKTVSNSISYLHANSWIFGPFLDILINFQKLKTDIDFPNF
jgi:hypothetical protein